MATAEGRGAMEGTWSMFALMLIIVLRQTALVLESDMNLTADLSFYRYMALGKLPSVFIIQFPQL